MNNALTPEVMVKIAGQSYQIRWDKAALFELGAFPEATEDINEENSSALFRRAIIYLFCMLKSDHDFKSPKDIATFVNDDNLEELMEGMNEAIMKGNGNREVADDPLPKSGLSQEGVSD